MTARRLAIAASILAADFSDLAGAVRQAERAGVDAIHIDVMDGHYVRNLTFGPKTVADLRPRTRLPLHVHLELQHPADFIAQFARAGADRIIVQADTCAAAHDVAACLAAVRATGVSDGLCLNPETPLDAALPWLVGLDELLFLSVHPGFGGQKFQPAVLAKVRAARQAIDALPASQGRPLISLDGGVNVQTLPACLAAGVDLVVAGSAVFGPGASIAENVRALRRCAP